MKKTLYLFFSLLLCFALFACTQEPSTTPNEVETATPEATPNEVEVITPNEVETITPTEPETPAEPEVPAEPEENVIVLPEADENTKYITIDFPTDFPEDPSAELNLVSPEEFEWGDYVPFIVTLDEGALKPPVYSIISSVSPTLDEGVELYTKLNNKYLEIYNGEKLPDWYGKEMTDALSDYLYKSRVVYISPEADIIGRFNLIPKNNYPSKERWNGQYDIFLNGEIDHSFFHNNILDYMTTGSFYDYITPIKLYFRNKAVDNVTIDSNFTYRYKSKTVYPYYFCEGVKRDAVYFNEKNYTEDGVIFTDRYTLLLLSQDKSRITHIINYDHLKEENGIYCTSIELYDGDIQIIEFASEINNYYIQALYSLDINTNELTYLESTAYTPNISPDGKYLVYFHSIGGDTLDGHTNPPPEKDGMFIKNLETGATVNYPIYRWNGGRLISWVNEEKLLALIGE